MATRRQSGPQPQVKPDSPSVVVSTDQTDPELLGWLRELGAQVTGKSLDVALLGVRLAQRAAGAA